MIKKEPERAAAAADYKLEIHILATFKTLGGSQIILGRLSILLYLVWSVGLALYRVSSTTIRNEAVFLLLRDFLFWGSRTRRRRRTHAKQYRDIKLYDNYQMGSTFHPNPKTKLVREGKYSIDKDVHINKVGFI